MVEAGKSNQLWGKKRGLAPEVGLGEVCFSGFWVSHDHLTVSPSQSQANALALFSPHHSAALDLRQPWPGKRLDHGLHLKRATDTYTRSTLNLYMWTGHICFSTPLFWGQRPRFWEREIHTLKGNRGILILTLRASASATWKQIPPLTGRWQPQSRKEVLFYTKSEL